MIDCIHLVNVDDIYILTLRNFKACDYDDEQCEKYY